MALCCAVTCSARDFAEKRFPIERLWNNLVKKTQYFGQIEPNYQEIYYDSMWEGKDGPTLMGSVGSLPSSYCQAWPQQRHPPQHLFPPLLPQQPGTSWESKVPSQGEGQGSKGLTGKPRVSWWRSLDWRDGLHNGELYTTHALKNRHTTRSTTSGLCLTCSWFDTRSTWESDRDGSIR